MAAKTYMTGGVRQGLYTVLKKQTVLPVATFAYGTKHQRVQLQVKGVPDSQPLVNTSGPVPVNVFTMASRVLNEVGLSKQANKDTFMVSGLVPRVHTFSLGNRF